MGVLLLFLIGTGFFYLFESKPRPSPAPKAVAEQSAVKQAEPARPLKASALPDDDIIPSEKKAPRSPEAENLKLPVGMIILRDIVGSPIARFPAVIVNDAWVAIPRKISLGAYDWHLQINQASYSIAEGVIADDDRLGLWRIQDIGLKDSPQLAGWADDMPVSWLSLESDGEPLPLSLSGITVEGNFVKVSLPDEADEAGIFLQGEQVVGWTFGEALKDGYLWMGDSGQNLYPQMRVDDFYRITFAGSREEDFLLALAMGNDYNDVEKLNAFAGAFRLESRIAERDTPERLQPDSIIKQMRTLIKELVQGGQSAEVANIFDDQILARAADVTLLIDAAKATQTAFGPEAALELIEDVKELSQFEGYAISSQVTEFHSRLYQDWIAALIKSGDSQKGWRAFERGGQVLPDDLGVHLMGVKLALAEDDWSTAEQLLALKEYPANMMDQVRDLQSQISELKGQTGKLVIRFAPGTSQIPVSATLGQSVEQRFIIDTGASTVTIPWATAEALGITVDAFNPVRNVYTASGMIQAPEVVLPSIEIDGWVENDVTALLLDLPNQTDTGLLGLSYLRRFRMDLNTEQGTLFLEPR